MKVLIDGQTLLTPEIKRGIGTYFRNVIRPLLELDFTGDYFTTVAEKSQLDALSGWARQRLIPLEHKAYDPRLLQDGGFDPLNQSYSAAIRDDLQRHSIDLYWNPNPLMGNVYLPEKCDQTVFAATIHDLVVLIMEDVYLSRWAPDIAAAYRSKLQILERDYDLFLYNSHYTSLDFRKHLEVGARAHCVTPLAASKFFSPDPFPAIASIGDYVLYISGFDPRKNLERAIQAFATLKNKYASEDLVKTVCLSIISSDEEEARAELLSRARALGIEDSVSIQGHVEHDDLRAIYRKARALFFPSLYEGFGLPLLEALACGIPVAASRTSSLPEVGGNHARYFDPYDLDEMADVLFEVLKMPRDPESRLERFQYSRTFSWEAAAEKTLVAFQSALSRPTANNSLKPSNPEQHVS